MVTLENGICEIRVDSIGIWNTELMNTVLYINKTGTTATPCGNSP